MSLSPNPSESFQTNGSKLKSNSTRIHYSSQQKDNLIAWQMRKKTTTTHRKHERRASSSSQAFIYFDTFGK